MSLLLKLLNFVFNAYPDPAFHESATSLEKLCGCGSATLVYTDRPLGYGILNLSTVSDTYRNGIGSGTLQIIRLYLYGTYILPKLFAIRD
jgi:hypothetical protein